MDPNATWEWIKHRIKEESSAFSGRLKLEQPRLEWDLTSRLEKVQQMFDEDQVESQDEYDSLKRQLREIELHRANSIIL